MSRTGAITRLIVWSVVAILLTMALISGVTIVQRGSLWPNFNEYFHKGERHEVFTQTVTANSVDQVEIEWARGDVTVEPSADTQVHVTQTSYYDVEPLIFENENGRLKIIQERWNGFAFFSLWRRTSDLNVQLPQKQYEKFKLKMTSGDSKVSEITVQECILLMTSGNLEVDKMTAQKTELRVTSGKMQVTSLDARELTFETTSGELKVEGQMQSITGGTTSGSVKLTTSVQPEKLDISMTSGNVAVGIPDSDGFKLLCKKTSGSFDTNFEFLTSKEGNETLYVYQSGGSNNHRYTVDMTSGTFKLYKAASGTTGDL